MKGILVLCLLASISCFNIINTGICLIGNEKVRTVAGDIFSSIKEKDFGKLLNVLLSNFSELKDIVSKCIKAGKDDDIVLKNGKRVICCDAKLTMHPDCPCYR